MKVGLVDVMLTKGEIEVVLTILINSWSAGYIRLQGKWTETGHVADS